MGSRSEISRVNRSIKQARNAYDHISRWYDWLSASSEKPFINMGLRTVDPHVGETVLEIGCGTGEALMAISAAVCETGKVHGIDLSAGMLNIAMEKIRRGDSLDRVGINQADGLHLPFGDSSFAVVFMSFTLELFDTPEIPLVLAECKRVLHPGGRFGVVAMVRDEEENFPQRIYEWAHQQMPVYIDCRPIFLQRSLTKAGFLIQEVTRKMMWGLPVEICVAVK